MENSMNFHELHGETLQIEHELNNLMTNELGSFYKGCIPIQGLMAFCSKARIHPEQHRNLKFQQKYLDTFHNYDTLYEISNIKNIESLIISQLKGLENKIVILLNINNIEDKKLIYVGMTRASERLYIHSDSYEFGNAYILKELASKI